MMVRRFCDEASTGLEYWPAWCTRASAQNSMDTIDGGRKLMAQTSMWDQG
jgi:hypothetical protein